ncbi:amidohydrolase family protein [Dactylosporangium sp. CA-233914]|uniref:amidohydrolase family protein n=1 Tax=Dactylosporangium sp. CA-233914 TaxID=3239934 RepID=UPI003D8AFB5C
MTERTAITNVRIFDGERLTEPRTVLIEGGLIAAGTGPAGARIVDAAGAVLLPGLIDAHVHLHGRQTLEQFAEYGVTTALDMAAWPPDLVRDLRGIPGLTDIRSAVTPAIGPGGMHARMPGMPAEAILRDPADAEQAVANRIAEGSDHLKIVLEEPGAGGPSEGAAAAFVAAGHAEGRRVVAHATSPGAYALALRIGADFLTHVPLGPPLEAGTVARMAADHRVAIPTLSMMEAIAGASGHPETFAGALRSVALMHAAGIPVLSGTDANATPGGPCPIRHGESLHHELDLLVRVGLTPAEALRAATSGPAEHFGLLDRGTVEPGKRADLLLVGGDPLTDITATRKIMHVWCGGIQRV